MIWVRYALIFLAVALGVAVLVQVFNTQMDTALGSGAQLMVPAMIASLVEGQQTAKAIKDRPGSAQKWRFVWIATGIATALNLALAYLAGGIAPEFGKLAIAEPMGQQFFVLLGIYAGGYLICNLFFYGIGVGNQLSLMRSRGEIE